MKLNLKHLLLAATLPAMLVSCDDEPDTPKRTNPSEGAITLETYRANEFVNAIMDAYYFWRTDMPDINYQTQRDTKAYFKALLSPEDRFSFISDDAQSMNEEFEGVVTSMGWDYTPTLYEQGSKDVIAIINYVYKGTPAYEAGVKRGDLLIYVDGVMANTSNYSSIFGQSEGKFTFLRYNETTGEYSSHFTADLTAAKVEENVVAEVSVFDGHIGYLLYTSYYSSFNQHLLEAMQYFKDNGVDELILDLRYNTGGEMTAMRALCSAIAPAEHVMAGKELIWYKYNDVLSKSEQFSRANQATRFDKTVPVNLDLKRVVIITGMSTYSASEATVIGLKPYMDVYTIGDITGGKNTSMFTLTPDLFDDVFDSSINNWMVAPIVARYYNCEDYTFDEKVGIVPDYEMNEYSFMDMGTLGDSAEPLTAAAVRYITTGSAMDVIGNNKSALSRDLLPKPSFHVGGAIMPLPAELR